MAVRSSSFVLLAPVSTSMCSASPYLWLEWFHGRCIGLRRGEEAPEAYRCHSCALASASVPRPQPGVDRYEQSTRQSKTAAAGGSGPLQKARRKPGVASSKRSEAAFGLLAAPPLLATVPEASASRNRCHDVDDAGGDICPVCEFECTCPVASSTSTGQQAAASRQPKVRTDGSLLSASQNGDADGEDEDYGGLMDLDSDESVLDSPDEGGYFGLSTEEAYLREAVAGSESLQEIDEEEDEEMPDAKNRAGANLIDSSEDDSVVHRMWRVSDSEGDNAGAGRENKRVASDVVYYLGQGWSTDDSGEVEDDEAEEYFDKLLERRRRSPVGASTAQANDESMTNDEKNQLMITGLVLVRAASPVITRRDLGQKKTRSRAASEATAKHASVQGAVASPTPASKPAPEPAPSKPTPSLARLTSPLVMPALMAITGASFGAGGFAGLSTLPNSSFYKPLTAIGAVGSGASMIQHENDKNSSRTPTSVPDTARPSTPEAKRDAMSVETGNAARTPSTPATPSCIMMASVRSTSENAAPLRIEDLMMMDEEDSDDDGRKSAAESDSALGRTADLGDNFSYRRSLPGTPAMIQRTRLTTGTLTVSSMLKRWDRIPIGAFRKSTRRRKSLPSLQQAHVGIMRGTAEATLVSSTAARRIPRSIFSPELRPGASSASWLMSGLGAFNGAGGAFNYPPMSAPVSELPSAVVSPLHSPLFGNLVGVNDMPPVSMLLGDPALGNAGRP